VALSHAMPSVTDTVGVLLILKAFASGCSALTGVEAIANSVPQFRRPRAKRAQHTEVSLGVLPAALPAGDARRGPGRRRRCGQQPVTRDTRRRADGKIL
jgi:hypothetical protein